MKNKIKPVTHEESSTETLCLHISTCVLGWRGLKEPWISQKTAGGLSKTGGYITQILSPVPFKYRMPNINHHRVPDFKRPNLYQPWLGEETGKRLLWRTSNYKPALMRARGYHLRYGGRGEGGGSYGGGASLLVNPVTQYSQCTPGRNVSLYSAI